MGGGTTRAAPHRTAGPAPTARIFIGSGKRRGHPTARTRTTTTPLALASDSDRATASSSPAPAPLLRSRLRPLLRSPDHAQRARAYRHQSKCLHGGASLTMSTSSANSAASPAVSGLDYDDTALTLALPGSSSSSAAADPADRKRAAADHDKPPSPK